MTAMLILLLGDGLQRPIRWAKVADGKIQRSATADGAAGLASLAEEAGEFGSLVALLPGEQVAVRRMPAGPKNRTKLRSAARYLMEDELAEAGDALEINAAQSKDLSVAFAARADIIRGWVQAFADAGLDCDVLSADFLALPSTAEEATVLIDGERVVAAFAGVGFALEADLFRAVSPKIFAEGPALFRVIGEDEIAKSLPPTSAIDWLGPADMAAILGHYARAIGENPPPNFLPKPFFRKRALMAAATPWRRAAMIAASLAGAFLIYLGGDAARASRVEARWAKAAREVHERAFPEAAAQDPAAHARSLLAGGGGGPSFVALASRLAAALGPKDDVEVDRIRWDAARGDLVISVRTKSDAAIDAFKAALTANGLDAQDNGGFRRDGEEWAGDVSARLK